MSYIVNGIKMSVIRTFTYEAPEGEDTSQNGTSCVELCSADKRYSLITDVDTYATLPQSDD